MNILYAIPWDQSEGGVTHVAASLARSLEARGHRAFFFFPGPGWILQSRTSLQGFPSIVGRLREYPPEVSPFRARLSWLSTVVTTLPQLARFARLRQIELINVHFPENSSALFVELARRLRVPLVVSAHGSDLLPDQGPCFDAGMTRLLDNASAVIVPSRTYLGDIVQAYPSVSKKAGYIYNGFRQEELTAMKPSPDRTGRSGTVALCIAALIHKKGIDVLLRALKACPDERLSLRLIGIGALQAELEALATELGVSNRVTFLGKKDRREVFEELSLCDFVVQPSRHASESFGLATLEGMACGKSVVASAIGGLRELVDDQVTGFLVPSENPAALAQALGRLARDPELRNRMGEQGRARAQRFTAQATADQYEQLFADLTSGRGRTPAEPFSDASS